MRIGFLVRDTATLRITPVSVPLSFNSISTKLIATPNRMHTVIIAVIVTNGVLEAPKAAVHSGKPIKPTWVHEDFRLISQ